MYLSPITTDGISRIVAEQSSNGTMMYTRELRCNGKTIFITMPSIQEVRAETRKYYELLAQGGAE